MNTWDLVRQQQLDRAAVEQLNAMAPYAGPLGAAASAMPPSASTVDLAQEADDAELSAYLEEYAYSVAALVASKQQDYGPNAISNAPGGALNGINVRLHDKLSRAANLTGKTHPAFNEPLFDTYQDIAGYALIAMLYLDGKW